MKKLKRLLASVLGSCMLLTFSAPAFASDSVTAANNTDAEIAKSLGLIKGEEDGVTLDRLEEDAQRFQVAIILLRIMGKEDEARAYQGDDNFTDADQVKWPEGRNILAYLKDNPQYGFIGYPDGRFGVDDKLLPRQLYKVLLTAMGYKEGEDFSYADVIEFAQARGFTGLSPDNGPVKVAQMISAVVEALGLPTADGQQTLAGKFGLAAFAQFGSPVIDGEVDEIWSKATPIVPRYSTTTENTTAEFRAMWDDKALYILAQVKDESLSKDSVNPYEQDSLEIFLDENNDKTREYGADDLQFRINYANEETADKGDLTRLYSQAKVVDGGYVIEARIAWDKLVPANGKVVGLELQINDAKGAARVGTINVFDGTNNAWQNTALFGNLILEGKAPGSLTGKDPYTLLSFIKSIYRKYNKDDYKNFDIVEEAIIAAEAVAADKDSTQEDYDEQYANLQKALSQLEYTEEAAKIKRFAEMPSEYKDVCTSGGTIETLSYDVKISVKDEDGTETEKTDTKYLNVYLPYGYDPDDKAVKYNVLYLMHGGGENWQLLFGGPGEERELKRILDNMIARGDIDPLIVVTPSFYNSDGSFDFNAFAGEELLNQIIPIVEGKYNTYAAAAAAASDGAITPDVIRATRGHRAFGGFSMGSVCTWAVLANCIDYVKHYIPLSGESWTFEGNTPAERAQAMAELLKAHNMGSRDFYILGATGSADIAYPNMKPWMDALEEIGDPFIFNRDLTVGNCYFMVGENGTHAWNFVNQYLYNILPDLSYLFSSES